MDKGVAFLLCVLYVALSQVPITDAEWRGNVCNEKKIEYVEERSCDNYISHTCVGYKTKMTSRVSYYKSCCPEWHHNGDQNCNIPICSPVCQNDATCVASYKCERTLDQADKNMTFAIGGPDNITFVPDKAIIHEFGALNITCLTNCDTFCSFQWIKHGNSDNEETVVADLATMQISNATRRDAGNYSCRAINRITNKTVVDSITLEVICNDDLGWNGSTDMTEKKPPLTDAVRIPNLIKALAGTGLVLTCLICGFLVYETRKRCYKPNSHFSTAVEDGFADTMEFNTYSDPCTDNWTIGNDSTGDRNTRVDNTGAHVYDQTLAIKQNLVYEDPCTEGVVLAVGGDVGTEEDNDFIVMRGQGFCANGSAGLKGPNDPWQTGMGGPLVVTSWPSGRAMEMILVMVVNWTQQDTCLNFYNLLSLFE